MADNNQIMEDSTSRVEETLAVYGSTAVPADKITQQPLQCRNASEDEEAFMAYYRDWTRAARLLAGVPAHINHPAFKAIVNMGTKAVPFIREILPTDRSYIIKALEQILGPLPAEWHRCSSHTSETINLQGVQLKTVPPTHDKESWIAYLKNYSTISRN